MPKFRIVIRTYNGLGGTYYKESLDDAINSARKDVRRFGVAYSSAEVYDEKGSLVYGSRLDFSL